MKLWFTFLTLVGQSVLIAQTTAFAASAVAAKEIDLGSSSIKGTIRYPSFQVIENTETLKETAQEVMSRELTRLEDEILSESEVDHEAH